MPALLWADQKGRILDHPYLEMAGFSAARPRRPEPGELVPLPPFSRLFYLPGCPPLGWDRKKGRFVVADFVRVGRRLFSAQAVAAFPAPGWVRTLLPAADYNPKKVILPMWAYTAVGLEGDDYLIPAFRVEESPHWDPANFDDREILPRLEKRLAQRRSNRLYAHLARCAAENHCFAAKNLFLGRGEAPLPVSRSCNAACLGCLSLQPREGPAASHHRIGFKPSPKEIVELCLDHLARVPEGILSFGQGCEGEPLTETGLIETAVRKLRAETKAGTVNLNTNGSDPEAVARLARAGLDSIRVSLVSPRPSIYRAYVRPRGFGLQEVEQSLATAVKAGLFTMINYLVFPGISDQEEEVEAMTSLLKRTGARFVHLKNLCLDPAWYLQAVEPGPSPALGMGSMAQRLVDRVEGLRLGYFNQPRVGSKGWAAE
jgi:pyruvate-formate lyase-activating enzyme